MACDFIEELKGILPLSHKDMEHETKTSKRVGGPRAKESQR